MYHGYSPYYYYGYPDPYGYAQPPVPSGYNYSAGPPSYLPDDSAAPIPLSLGEADPAGGIPTSLSARPPTSQSPTGNAPSGSSKPPAAQQPSSAAERTAATNRAGASSSSDDAIAVPFPGTPASDGAQGGRTPCTQVQQGATPTGAKKRLPSEEELTAKREEVAAASSGVGGDEESTAVEATHTGGVPDSPSARDSEEPHEAKSQSETTHATQEIVTGGEADEGRAIGERVSTMEEGSQGSGAPPSLRAPPITLPTESNPIPFDDLLVGEELYRHVAEQLPENIDVLFESAGTRTVGAAGDQVRACAVEQCLPSTTSSTAVTTVVPPPSSSTIAAEESSTSCGEMCRRPASCSSARTSVRPAC